MRVALFKLLVKVSQAHKMFPEEQTSNESFHIVSYIMFHLIFLIQQSPFGRQRHVFKLQNERNIMAINCLLIKSLLIYLSN